MANIIPFDQKAVPAWLQAHKADNADLLAHAGASFPVMSIKGKVFTLVRGDERQIVPNPKDPDSPATKITVAIIKVSPHKSKTYYANGFSEGSEDNKPTCFSTDGIKPDSSIQNPQCKTCAACKWNAFGTARGENGQPGKGKACSDFIRVAIADLSNIEEPILLRVPPASNKAIGDYGKALARRNVSYQGVATTIGFDMAQATPRLTFTPAGLLDEETFNVILEQANSDVVRRMMDGLPAEPAEEPAKAEPEMEIPQTVVKSSVSKPAPKAAPAPAVPPAQTKEEETADSIIAAAMGNTKMVSTEDGLAQALDDLGFE
ncbi:MAG: hypothetical protein ACI4SV_00755 [Duodenibacillus sp.]